MAEHNASPQRYGMHINPAGFVVAAVQGDNPVWSWGSYPGMYDGKWKHIAMTADTTTGEVILFVNGVPVYDDYPGLTAQFSKVPHLFFGQRQSADTSEGIQGAGLYRGMIDEIMLFNRALTPLEVMAIYDAGSKGACNAKTGIPQ